ncbi:hypothetical protein SNE40_017762 [Patella caerulea]|uniref:Uncharacterized protein n=1 Tax=Patella caerulea TaxID=87958 RepID=A0AAN8JB18_PATCE
MANNGHVQIKLVLIMVVILSIHVSSTEGQWAQTIGWGSAGLGKRAPSHTSDSRKHGCVPDPVISSLIIQLSKYEADRLKQCEMAASLDEI